MRAPINLGQHRIKDGQGRFLAILRELNLRSDLAVKEG